MDFRKFIETDWDDFFNVGNSKIIGSEEKTARFNLELYRGFDANLPSLEQDDRFYFFSPKRAEQGQLWFTHKYVVHYDPVEYAKNHGEWFMRYDLPVIKHVKINRRDDGETTESLPDWWTVDPTKDGRFHAGIELPEGWVFSYKMEKFIGCRVKIKVPKNQILPSSDVS